MDFCRAADWDLANPSWKGRMKVVLKEKQCLVKLEDRSGEYLHSQCGDLPHIMQEVFLAGYLFRLTYSGSM